MLQDIRVLEVSAPGTMLAGRILGDLGAEVVVVEPSDGAPGRRIPPFEGHLPGAERSFTWQALNYNKRGMTLNLRHAEGVRLLQDLIPRFDVLIHASDPREPSAVDALRIPETAIRTIVRPFSKAGPKARYAATELVLMAASGAPALAGEPDRAPLFFPTPQALMEVGAEAATATLGALAARDRDGLGQTVEVSNRVAAMAGALGQPIAGFAGDEVTVRSTHAGGAISGTVSAPPMYKCEDGFVLLQIIFSAAFVVMTRAIAKWAFEEGELDPRRLEFDWGVYATPRADLPREPLEHFVAALTRLCARSKKQDITAAARKYGFMAAPIMDMRDIANSRQFRERGLFVRVPAGEGRAFDVPARFACFGDDYQIEVRRPAPRLSQHTCEILTAELGFSGEELQALYVNEVI